MSLSSLLAAAIDDHSDDQGPWRQFILDHLDYIAARSKRYIPGDLVMYQYRYDLLRYLQVERSRTIDMSWIVLLLNDIANDFDFEESQELIIPDDALIQRLRLKYITVINNAQ